MKKAWPPLRSDCPATRDRFDLQRLGGHEAVEAIMQRVAARFAHDNLNMADGIRVDYQDGWFHVRASNTEPIVRLIAEAGTDEGALATARRSPAPRGCGRPPLPRRAWLEARIRKWQ